MKYLILLIFTQIVHSAEYGNCNITKGFTSSFEDKYLADCEYVSPGYLSKQSFIKNPQYQLLEIIIPHKDPEKESLRISFDEPIEYDFDSDYGCETIECFDKLDHLKILRKESPEFFEKIFSSLVNKESLKLEDVYIVNEFESLELNSASPIFYEAPTGIDSLFTEIVDIDAHSYFIYDGTLDEPLLKFKPKSKEYLDLYGNKEYVVDSDGNKIFIADVTILEDETGSEQQLIIPNVESEREIDSLNEITFSKNNKTYTITPLSESSSGTRFLISDGTNQRTFESIDYIFLEDHESISELYFDESGIKVVDIFDIPYTLDAKIISDDVNEEKEGVIETSECLEALSSYLNNKNFSHDDLKSFLKVQSNLTLHRLSWAQISSNKPKEKLEQKILSLLKTKFDKHPDIAKEFDTINIKSRNFLAKAIPIVYEEMNAQSQIDRIESEPYKLNISDLKMLEILSSFEELDDQGFWDHRQFKSKNNKNSIANFTSLINSAYLHSDYKLKTKEDIEKNKIFLSKEISELESELTEVIKRIILNSCVDQQGLSCEDSITKVNRVFDNQFDQIYGVLLNQISNYKDEDFITNIKFGHIWPKVKI